jgi:4-aminobutyrate--pyruvate transaminase
LVGEATGIGMLAVAELIEDRATKKAFDPARKIGPYLVERAKEHGLIVRAMGDRIAFSPPLIIEPDQIRDMFAMFSKALDETTEWAA